MGVLFIVMATVIALRNLYLYSTELSVGFYLDNFTSNSVTNEKFVIAMLVEEEYYCIGVNLEERWIVTIVQKLVTDLNSDR